MMAVDPADIRAFLGRDRASVEALKRRYWASRYRTLGPAATLAAAHELYAQLRAARPDYPGARARAADLAHHLELRRKLDRAAHGLALR
jgi:hypothetical protein